MKFARWRTEFRAQKELGEFARQQENTISKPHQLVLDGAKEFTYFVVKIKGY